MLEMLFFKFFYSNLVDKINWIFLLKVILFDWWLLGSLKIGGVEKFGFY